MILRIAQGLYYDALAEIPRMPQILLLHHAVLHRAVMVDTACLLQMKPLECRWKSGNI